MSAGAAGLFSLAAGLCSLAAGAATVGGAAVQDPPYYVALGASASVGFQPTSASPHGERTDEGYANDLLDSERSRWANLRLVELGCPGETTATMLDGGGTCHYSSASQLAAAVSFLQQHPSTVLVTVDLGFNDVARCLAYPSVDEACVTRALEDVEIQLPQILTMLKGVASPDLHIVGLTHYDPYLAAYLDGPVGQSFASQSLSAILRLNDALRRAYNAAGIPVADVAAAFAMTDTEPVTLPGVGIVPRNVERTCTLTWECAPAPLGPNKHPNDAGYRVISAAVSDAVTS